MLAIRLGPAEVRFTGRAEGDFSVHARDAREARQRAVVDRVWKTAKQIHGTRVVVVDRATDIVGEADALVTIDPTIALAVKTADCAPIALVSDGMVGVVHAGWRGLVDGVLEEAVAAMTAAGAGAISAALGPCIGPECYEFGEELDQLTDRFGGAVRSVTRDGHAALDLPAAVRTALDELDVRVVADHARCTACEDESWWSHRARAETERQATVVWLR